MKNKWLKAIFNQNYVIYWIMDVIMFLTLYLVYRVLGFEIAVLVGFSSVIAWFGALDKKLNDEFFEEEEENAT